MNRSVGGQGIPFKSQVANITKPLASSNEIVDSWGHDYHAQDGWRGHERASAANESDILSYIKRIEGESISATRRKGAFVIDVEVKE